MAAIRGLGAGTYLRKRKAGKKPKVGGTGSRGGKTRHDRHPTRRSSKAAKKKVKGALKRRGGRTARRRAQGPVGA